MSHLLRYHFQKGERLAYTTRVHIAEDGQSNLDQTWHSEIEVRQEDNNRYVFHLDVKGPNGAARSCDYSHDSLGTVIEGPLNGAGYQRPLTFPVEPIAAGERWTVDGTEFLLDRYENGGEMVAVIVSSRPHDFPGCQLDVTVRFSVTRGRNLRISSVSRRSLPDGTQTISTARSSLVE
jgi:hypothetical protein